MSVCRFSSDLQNLSGASFEPVLPDQLAVVGEHQELQVTCLEPSGLPAPRIYWKDPRGHIISDSGPVRVQDNTLILGKARLDEDGGNYTCVAENLAAVTEMTVQVIVSSEWRIAIHSLKVPVVLVYLISFLFIFLLFSPAEPDKLSGVVRCNGGRTSDHYVFLFGHGAPGDPRTVAQGWRTAQGNRRTNETQNI